MTLRTIKIKNQAATKNCSQIYILTLLPVLEAGVVLSCVQQPLQSYQALRSTSPVCSVTSSAQHVNRCRYGQVKRGHFRSAEYSKCKWNLIWNTKTCSVSKIRIGVAFSYPSYTVFRQFTCKYRPEHSSGSLKREGGQLKWWQFYKTLASAFCPVKLVWVSWRVWGYGVNKGSERWVFSRRVWRVIMIVSPSCVRRFTLDFKNRDDVNEGRKQDP